MRLNDIAKMAKEDQYPIMPFDTGNLRESVGDLSGYDNVVEYGAFNINKVALYGKMLNEDKIIRRRYTKNGETKEISYENKHYGFYDKYVADFAKKIDAMLGTRSE